MSRATNRLERIGLGGGERLQRFEPGCGERHRGHCGLRFRCGRGRGRFGGLRDGGHDPGCGCCDCGSSTCKTHLLEQMSARDIAGRTAPVVVVGHDVLPRRLFFGLGSLCCTAPSSSLGRSAVHDGAPGPCCPQVHSRVPDAVQRERQRSGAPLLRDRREGGVRNGPGSATHHCALARFVLRCARDTRAGQCTAVTPGLDPGVHPPLQDSFAKRMDCRVKPGNDESLA